MIHRVYRYARGAGGGQPDEHTRPAPSMRTHRINGNNMSREEMYIQKTSGQENIGLDFIQRLRPPLGKGASLKPHLLE